MNYPNPCLSPGRFLLYSTMYLMVFSLLRVDCVSAARGPQRGRVMKLLKINRRHFVKSATAGASLAALPGILKAQQAP